MWTVPLGTYLTVTSKSQVPNGLESRYNQPDGKLLSACPIDIRRPTSDLEADRSELRDALVEVISLRVRSGGVREQKPSPRALVPARSQQPTCICPHQDRHRQIGAVRLVSTIILMADDY